MRVLMLPPPPRQVYPWRDDMIRAIEARNQLKIWDSSAPMEPQFDVDVVVDYGPCGTREMADLSSSVKLWQLVTVGYDKFDVGYWSGKGIPLANCPGETSADGVADCAIMLMLMLLRQWNESQDNLGKGIMYVPMGYELGSMRLGLLGFGATARSLARRAKGFGMQVYATDIVPISKETQAAYGLAFAGTDKDIDTLVSEVDCLSLHLPLTAETRGIIDRRRIGLMKPTSYFINVARGALVDEKALTQALSGNRIAGAGLDVFESEPPDADNPLFRLPNVVATPHLGGNTFRTSLKRAEFVAQNIERVAAGQELLCRIDQNASNGQRNRNPVLTAPSRL